MTQLTQQSFLQRQAGLSPTKLALLQKRLKQLTVQAQGDEQIRLRPQSETLPLSFAQLRLWFLQQLEPESPAYNETLATRLSGPLNRTIFDQTARELLRRHEVLRCRFPLVEGQVVQVLDQQIHEHFSFPFEDLRSLPPEQREAEVMRRAQQERLRPFDLTRELPWRTWLWQIDDEEYFSLTIMHHIVTDGWSFSNFLREISQLYDAFEAGRPSPLPEPRLQYADYAYQQQQWVESEAAQPQLRYWQKRLEAPLPRLDLPSDRSHPEEPTYQGQRSELVLTPALSQQLQTLSRQAGTTLFMTLQAGLLALLARYSQQEDILVGTPIAGRTRPELEDLLGCFVNTLVLRTDLSGNPTVEQLLQRVRQVTREAYEHQEVPFEKLVELLQPERSLSHNPLFQVMFVLQNVPPQELIFGNLSCTTVEIPNYATKFDLMLVLQEEKQGIEGYFEFSTDVFEARTIQQLQRHFVQILHAMVSNPAQRISDIPLLSQEELSLLHSWNETQVGATPTMKRGATGCPDSSHFLDDFLAQVARTPDAPAVSDDHEQVSYQQLHTRSDQLAAHLLAHGIQPEEVIGLYTHRSVLWAVSLLAILKAGAVYLPLDPQYPAVRLQSILQQSQCKLLLTPSSLQTRLASTLLENAPEILCPDALLATELSNHRSLPVIRDSRLLAYIIFTSGSTGQPKGVMLEHGGMHNHLHAKRLALELAQQDVIAQTASHCFDISLWQLLSGWLVGAQVRIYPDWLVADPHALLQQIEQDQVSILEVVPSWLQAALEHPHTPALARLRWLIPTGEALSVDLCRRWLARYPQIPLLNAYGPTECSDDVTHQVIAQPPEAGQWASGVPIGSALPNLRLYVLDRQGQPQPIGVWGELYIGGVGVGRGYVGLPARTAASFVPDPFGSQPGARLYRSGDLARYRADGSLEFQGRVDQQVKLRGYRIELGEIEQALRQLPGVRQSAVALKTDAQGQQRLVGYVVLQPETSSSFEQAQQALHDSLPDYMVPAAIVPLEALPLSANGKLDRQRLPEPQFSLLEEQAAYIAPRTPLEEQLAAIWIGVLGLQRVGIHDNFFALGGHSLLITQILVRVQETFQVTLPVRSMFKNPTIAGLAETIEKVQSRSSELRTHSVVSVSREAYRHKRSTPETGSVATTQGS